MKANRLKTLTNEPRQMLKKGRLNSLLIIRITLIIITLGLCIFNKLDAQIINETFEESPWLMTSLKSSDSVVLSGTVSASTVTFFTNSNDPSATSTSINSCSNSGTWFYSVGRITTDNKMGYVHSASHSWFSIRGGYLISPVIKGGIINMSVWLGVIGGSPSINIGLNTNTNAAIPSNVSLSQNFSIGSQNVKPTSQGLQSFSFSTIVSGPCQLGIFNNDLGHIFIDDITISSIPLPCKQPTLTGISTSPACSGSNALINLSGLVPMSTDTVYYNVNGGMLFSAIVNSSNTGDGSFSLPVSYLNNGQILTVKKINIDSCSNNFNSSTNLIVNQPAKVNIVSSDTILCSGTTVLFSANQINGGTSPIYKWKLNGIDVGVNSPSYTNSTLKDKDVVSCILINNTSCAKPDTAISNNIVLSVSAAATTQITNTISDCDSIIYKGKKYTYSTRLIDTIKNTKGCDSIYNITIINIRTITTEYGYIPNSNSNTISVINPLTNSVVASIPVGSFPFGACVTPDGKSVYVTNQNSNNVSVINTANNTVIATVGVGNYPENICISPDGKKVYITNRYDSTISIINPMTNTVSKTVKVGVTPYGMCISPDGSKVYVCNNTSNSISILSGTADTIMNTINSVVNYPGNICISSDGSKIYAITSSSNISIINTITNTISTPISTGSSNSIYSLCITPDGRKIYTTQAGSGSVNVINTSNNAIIKTISVGSLPYGISVSPDGSKVYAVNNGSNSVSVISTTSDSVIETITVGLNPIGFGTFVGAIPISKKTNNIKITGCNKVNYKGTTYTSSKYLLDTIRSIYGCDSIYNNINIIVGNSIPTSFKTINLTGCNGLTYKTISYTSSTVIFDTVKSYFGCDSIYNTVYINIITPKTDTLNYNNCSQITYKGITYFSSTSIQDTIKSYQGCDSIYRLVNIKILPSSSNAYIACGDGTVNVINTITNTVTASIIVGNTPIGLSVTPDGSKVYVANYVSGTVSVINTATNTVITTINVGNHPEGVGVSPDGTKVYVANTGSNTISIINTATNTVTASVNVLGNTPYALCVSPDGTKVYVANFNSNTVSVISTTTNTVKALINVGSGPMGICISPEGSKVYVTNNGGYSVSVINTANNSVISTLSVGSGPYSVNVSPDGINVYVTNEYSNTISVINSTTNSVTSTVAVGALPQGICVSPDGTKVYVINESSNSVSIINTATNTLITTIGVGNLPAGFGNFINNVSLGVHTITNLSSCDSIIYKGISYTTSTVVRDTVKGSFGCDSLFKTVNILIHKIAPKTVNINLSGCNSVIYKSIVYTSTITVLDTTRSVYGCDSIYYITKIVVTPFTSVTNTINLSGCNSVLYNGITYLSSTIVRDTVRSYLGCNSLYNIANITIYCIPKINSFSPKISKTGGAIIIKGGSFTNAKTVSFGGVAANSFVVIHDSTISAIVGTGASGYVKVTNAAGADSLSGFTYCQPITISLNVRPVSIKSGDSVYMNAVVNNTVHPVYSWMLNNTVVNTSNSNLSYVMGALKNNDIVSFMVKDTLSCGLPVTFYSNNYHIYSSEAKVYTVAGNGTGGYSGDGGLATSAKIGMGYWKPYGIAVDNKHNLYIADRVNNVIRKVDANGIITTIAGNTVAGYSGDGGSAKSAKLNNPSGVAIDNVGNIYIADNYNNVIRKVDTVGIISTFAGTNKYGYSGDGGLANAAMLGYPVTVKTDNKGSVFITDQPNNAIRKVDKNGIITTVAGGGSGGDGGLATSARLNYPSDVAIDKTGNLFIAGGDSYLIRKVDTMGIITTVAGGGSWHQSLDSPYNGMQASNASFYFPSGIAVDNAGNLYVTDSNNLITKIDTAGYLNKISSKWSNNYWGLYSGDSSVAVSTSLGGIAGIVVDSIGDIYVAECGSARILKITSEVFGGKKIINSLSPIGKKISGVQIKLVDTLTTKIISIDSLGLYNLKSYSSNYNIYAYKNNDINKANGVTTLDIALTQSHILGKTLFNSPYKIIAADVNGDSKVSALDIVYMKRLILGIDTTFTYGTAKDKRLWAFVDSSYSFSVPTNPFPFKDSISYTSLSANTFNLSFIGCKLGDVNWDWNPAIARPGISEMKAVELYYSSDDERQSSDEVRIPIRVKNFKELLGLQYTINFNATALKFVGVNNKALNVEIGTNHAAEGKLSFLWVDAKSEAKTLEDGSLVFELVFERTGKEAIGKEAIVKTLSIDGSVTTVVAYDKESRVHDVVMRRVENIQPLQLESWVVAPNPTKDGVIQVQMNLSNNKTVVFRLLDKSGRLLMTKEVEGMKGANHFTLREGNIASGIYYLQAVGVEGVKQLRIEN